MGMVTVDFVTRGADDAYWTLVLVEQGPWSSEQLETNLRRLQDRLYTSIDAALDGALATQFPESSGKPLRIRLDGYNLPESQVRGFFERFSQHVLQLPDYAAALSAGTFVPSIDFELCLEQLQS